MRVDAVECESINLVEEDDCALGEAQGVDLLEEASDVLGRLAELAVYDHVEVDREELPADDAGNLSRRLGLACPRRALEEELVDAGAVRDGVADARHVRRNGLGQRQRRRGGLELAEESALVVGLRHEGIRVRDERHDVFGELVVPTGIEVTRYLCRFAAEGGLVAFLVIPDEVDDVALLHGCPYPSS